MSPSILLKGFIIGLSIAAPVGPIGILCIRRTLAEGRLSGFISGLGAATADATYGMVAAFGLTIISNFLIGQSQWLNLFGGLFLIFLGVKTLFTKSKDNGDDPNAISDRKSLTRNYLSTFLLTITNPLTIISFAAIIAGLGVGIVPGGGFSNQTWLVIGVFLGSTVWWFTLSGITAIFRRKITSTWMNWINRGSGTIIILFGVVALLNLLNQALNTGNSTQIENQRSLDLSAVPLSIDGYNRVTGPGLLAFPEDHGPHPDYLTEWWYYTGNLQTSGGRRFGYQFTIFRRSIQPIDSNIERTSAWATDQVYLAHFAISDIDGNNFHALERFGRGSLGLSGAQSLPFKVWLYDWRVEGAGEDIYKLYAEQGDLTIDLLLEEVKDPVLHGNDGYSQKGIEPGNASTYISLTRLRTIGVIRIGKDSFEVGGNSWMDHEFSTNALSSDQVGWDWFAIQLDNSTELMLYTIRREDGSIDPFSSGTFIHQDGHTVNLKGDEFSISILDSWESPHSQAVYPSSWQVRVDSLDLDLTIEPLLADQELNLTYTYWEGAVVINGIMAGNPVNGVGYVELTGYKGPFAGDF